jgi:glycosyltransferase involved in cell wall biosynthesis
MKKVLIITNLFHASPRIPGLSKYLREFGWEPVILCTPLGKNPQSRLGPPNDFAKEFRVIEVPYPDIINKIKRLLGFKEGEGSRTQIEKILGGEKQSPLKTSLRKIIILGAAFLAYPDEMRFWRKPATKKAQELLKNEHFDAILSSSSPVTSHRIAQTAKRTGKLPWIADLRDLWTQNHNYLYPKLRKRIEEKLERRTLKDTDAMATVSDALVAELKSRFHLEETHNIPNGFDPEMVNNLPAPLTEKFTITYTGSIYVGKQDPKKVLKALRELIDEQSIDPKIVELRFYGAKQGWLQDDIERFLLRDIATQHGPISRPESFLKQRESQVLLVFGWEDPYEVGIFPIKVFEYMAARRPILATGGAPGEKFKTMLEETNSGLHGIEIEKIKEIILTYYAKYLNNGSVPFSGIQEEIDHYSYRAMAKKFAAVLDRVTESHN